MELLYTEKNISLLGIPNVGNTCYLNTFLQNLKNVYFLSMLKTIITELRQVNKENKFINILFNFLIHDENNKDYTVLHTQLYNMYKMILSKKGIHIHDQNDSHEIYLETINIIYTIIGQLPPKQIVLLKTNIYGEIIHQIKCLNCDYINHTKEEFTTISINLNKSIRNSIVNDMVNNNIDGWKCEKCEKSNIEKKYGFSKLPNIFYITIKDHYHKNYDNIDINDSLKINTVFDKTSFIEYNLYSIGIRTGNSVNSGHYFSIIIKNGKYFILNDNHVQEIDKKKYDDLKKHFYILIYIKNY